MGSRPVLLPDLPLQLSGAWRAEGQGVGVAGGAAPGPPDAQQRPGFMDLHVTHGAVLVGLQVAHDAGFADCGGGGAGGGERKQNQSPLHNPGPAPPHPRHGLCSHSGHPSSPPCPHLSALQRLHAVLLCADGSGPLFVPRGVCACLCQTRVVHQA